MRYGALIKKKLVDRIRREAAEPAEAAIGPAAREEFSDQETGFGAIEGVDPAVGRLVTTEPNRNIPSAAALGVSPDRGDDILSADVVGQCRVEVLLEIDRFSDRWLNGSNCCCAAERDQREGKEERKFDCHCR